MAEGRCLNCESTVPEAARFCPTCSQRADTARLSFTDMARDLLHTFVNIERGPVVFAWALLTRPGGIAREYVEGRRRRYYGPFATLAVLVGMAALALRLSGVQVLSQEMSATSATTLLQRHFDVVLLAQLPLLGVVCSLLFRDAHLTLPEHMVLAAYALSVRAVALIVVLPIPLSNATSAPTFWQNSAFWVAWYLYFGWAASQFYVGMRWSWLRGMLVAAIGHVLILAVLIGGNAVYEKIVKEPTAATPMSATASIDGAGPRGSEARDTEPSRPRRVSDGKLRARPQAGQGSVHSSALAPVSARTRSSSAASSRASPE